jgi:AcrR family transcriptional regulator
MSATDKRRQILEAASACLARYGYDKTTLDDIASRIGLNKTSLYYYYPNKEAIFTAVLVAEAEVFLTALQRKAGRARGCRGQILTYLTERFRYYRHVVNLHNLSLEVLQRIQPAFQALYRDLLQREIGFIAQLLTDGMARGEVQAAPAERVARIILTLADALKQGTCEAPAPGAAETIDYAAVEKEVDFAVQLILDGLAPGPAREV